MLWLSERRSFSFLALLSLGIALSARADNLGQAINQTIATHPQILTAESLQDAASEDVRVQQGGYYPRLDVTAGYGRETSDNPATRSSTQYTSPITLTRQESSFLLSQLLFDGGNVANNVAKTKASYQTSIYQVYQTQEALGYDAALAYLTVMQDRELLKISQLNVKAHKDVYQKIAKRVQGGAGKKSDLDLAESRLASALAGYVDSEGQVQNDEATYIKVVGMAPSAFLDLPPEPQNIPFTLTQAQALAVQLNPSLAGSKTQIASNLATVGVAKSAYFPKVTLDLSAGFSDSLDGVPGYNNEKQAMIRVNYNVFRGGSDKAAVAAARYRVVASEQDAKRLEREVLETVAFAWNGMQISSRKIPELQIHSTQSYNVWQAYVKQFQLGQRTLFDLLNSQAEYYTAQSDLIRAQYQERINRYQLLASIGELVSTVKNPDYRHQAVYIQHPKSMLKKIHVTLPASVDAGAVSGTPPTNPSGWQYPKDSGTVPSTNTAPAHPQIKIPSLEKPSSLSEPASIKSSSDPLSSAAIIAPPPGPLNQAADKPIISASLTQPLMENRDDTYHLQLLAAHKKETLLAFAASHHLSSTRYHIETHIQDQTDWYALIYGNYASLTEAKSAMHILSAEKIQAEIV